MIALVRRRWATATFGATHPLRRLVGLAACGVASGVGETLVVVLVVGLVSDGGRTRLPFLGQLPGTWPLAGLTLALLLGLAAAHAGAAWISARSARDVQRTVQSRLVTTYLAAPWSVQSNTRAGELQQLVTVRTQTLAFGTQAAAQALSSALNLMVVVVAAIVLDPLATVGLALVLATVLAISVPLRRQRRRAVRAAARVQGDLALELAETAHLARELRVFGVSRTAGGRLVDRVEEAADRQGRTRLAGALAPPLTRDLTVALLVVALAVVVSQGARTAVLGAAVVLVLRALSHAQGLSSSALQWTEREDAVQQIRNVLKAWNAPGTTGNRPCPEVRTLALHKVAFTYPESTTRALHGVDVTLRRGELVGVVGRTGGGKSTLAGVLLGLLAPDEGAVFVDGVPLAELDADAWHARTACVGQEPRLLGGTLADNVRFFRPDITDAAVADAVRAAGLHGELALDAPVGPAGAALSGGQRQRIAVARALAGRPDVVVLDEPTSALDVHAEALVRDALHRLQKDRIVVVIAHRLSTVKGCDRLLVVDAGRVRELDAPNALERADEAWLRAELAR